MPQNKKNTGRSHELLVKAVFEQILAADSPGFRTIEVQHNKKLKGQVTQHQIDIFWRFELAGIEYQTVVQAKDWRRPVSKEAVLAFAKVLQRIPGQPRGLMVSVQGFQEGAIREAAIEGIEIFTLAPKKPPQMTLKPMGFCRPTFVNVPVSVESPFGVDIVWEGFDCILSNLRISVTGTDEQKARNSAQKSLTFQLDSVFISTDGDRKTLGQILSPLLQARRESESYEGDLTFEPPYPSTVQFSHDAEEFTLVKVSLKFRYEKVAGMRGSCLPPNVALYVLENLMRNTNQIVSVPTA